MSTREGRPALREPPSTTAPGQRPDTFERDAQEGYWILTFFIAMFAFIAVMVMLSSRRPDIAIEGDTLAIRAGAYGARVPVAEMLDVQLEPRLSGIGAKRNAFQFGNHYHGTFTVEPYGRTLLFLDATKPPFVRVRSAKGTLIFSAGDSSRTRGLFDSLLTLRRPRAAN